MLNVDLANMYQPTIKKARVLGDDDVLVKTQDRAEECNILGWIPQ